MRDAHRPFYGGATSRGIATVPSAAEQRHEGRSLSLPRQRVVARERHHPFLQGNVVERDGHRPSCGRALPRGTGAFPRSTERVLLLETPAHAGLERCGRNARQRSAVHRDDGVTARRCGLPGSLRADPAGRRLGRQLTGRRRRRVERGCGCPRRNHEHSARWETLRQQG